MAVNHPDPAVSTVKELYGTALRCAFPTCAEPLYRVDASGTTRTLNSRVAHICARSEGGPRWDPNMSPEDNRSGDNLVLLCTPHSYEIDDPGLATRYPAPLLRDYKQAQIAEFDRAVALAGTGEGLGIRLTDAEAAEVIEASEHNTNVLMQAHTIQIGGSGGNLGGGGGGGGVVGSGVLVGGPGGDGQIPKIILDGQPGKFPGAGGGGGGLLSPGTVEAPPRSGASGLGHVAGVDGSDGGDTTISVDGTILLRAAGGKGARAGTGIRATTDRLAVSTLLLASYYSVMAHGLTTVVDGGWENISILNVPQLQNFPLFIVFEAGGVAVGEYAVTIDAQAPSGAVRASANIALVVAKAGDLIRIPFGHTLQVPVDEFGIWRVVVKSEVAQLAVLDLMIKRVGEAAPVVDTAPPEPANPSDSIN